MDLQYKMVLDPTCSVEGGVLFWKGRLTYKQAQSLRGDGFVKAIITIVADVPQKVIPGARMKRSKRQAKDQKTYNSPHLKSKIRKRDNPLTSHGVDKRTYIRRRQRGLKIPLH